MCVSFEHAGDPRKRKLPVLRDPAAGRIPSQHQILRGYFPGEKGLRELDSNSITLPAKIPALLGGRRGPRVQLLLGGGCGLSPSPPTSSTPIVPSLSSQRTSLPSTPIFPFTPSSHPPTSHPAPSPRPHGAPASSGVPPHPDAAVNCSREPGQDCTIPPAACSLPALPALSPAVTASPRPRGAGAGGCAPALRTFSSGRSGSPDPGLPRRRGRRDGEELCGRRPPTGRGAGTGELRAHRTAPGPGVRKLDPGVNLALYATRHPGDLPTRVGRVLCPHFLFSASILIRPFSISLTPCLFISLNPWLLFPSAIRNARRIPPWGL